MEKTNAEIGHRGEDMAQEFLQREGFTLLHRNWRNGRYELDLVAEKEGLLHIVEVKTRVAGNPTSPEDAFTRAKFKALCRAAESYIEQFGVESEVQFDLIAIENTGAGGFTLKYIPAVMSPAW
jgi:putative endonuclease